MAPRGRRAGAGRTASGGGRDLRSARLTRTSQLPAGAAGAGVGVRHGAVANLVVQVQQHLDKNPTDGRGWNVLAPVLERLGRFDEAVRAYRSSITYNGESAERRSDLGEAIRLGPAA